MDAGIRVLMITSEWPTPERPHDVPFLVRQVEFLRRAGVDVDVFSFRGAKRPQNYARAWARLRATLRRGRYDLVHAQFGQSALLPWPKRLPLVVTFHGCEVQGVKGPDGRTTPAGWALQRLCRAVALRADGVIAVSRRIRALLPASAAVEVIPLGLDLDAFPAAGRAEARRELGLPPDERLVLFAANPEETVKRFDLARRSVDLLAGRLPARLIVGWGMTNERILMHMRACDVLLLTSMQEGSPTVVKEALACDLPVVSVDVGDVRERVGRVDGCEVTSDDTPGAIAASLERVLSAGGRVRGRDAVRDLDEKLVTQRVIAVYRSALARGRAGARSAARPAAAGFRRA